MAGAGLIPGKVQSSPTKDHRLAQIDSLVRDELTVMLPYLTFSKIGFNFKRKMLRRRALLCLMKRLADAQKFLWSGTLNRMSTLLNECNPYLVSHALVVHFECFGCFRPVCGRDCRK